MKQRIQESGPTPATAKTSANQDHFGVVNFSRTPSSSGNIHCSSHRVIIDSPVIDRRITPARIEGRETRMIFRIERRDVCTGRRLSQIHQLSARVSAHHEKYEIGK